MLIEHLLVLSEIDPQVSPSGKQHEPWDNEVRIIKGNVDVITQIDQILMWISQTGFINNTEY